MRGIKKWTLSLFYFIPVIWFMYVSVELLAERSSSLAAMELAYRLHRQHHHLQDSAQADVLPADRQNLNQLLNVLQDNQNGRGGDAVNVVDKGLAAMDLQFQEKLERFRRHRQGALAPDTFKKENPPEVLKEVGKREDSRVQRVDGVVDMQVVPGQGVKEEEEEVQFPPYVEAWGPNLPGEEGKPVYINLTELTPEERQRYQKGWADNSFNQYASDIISVHRSLPDKNPPECLEQRKEYSDTLPEVSVIIIFHNEAWSVLLRSVHSVLSRTPRHLLRQIILVDDLSSMDHLKRPLEVYWKREPKVSIVRAPKRVGLTQARLLGYQVATAEVLVFLDSHIECFPGWVEPLLDRIVRHPGAVPYPDIEIIYDDTLRVGFSDPGSRAIFRWKDLTFQWEFVPDYEKARRKNKADFIRSPTMPGGLFAISRQFFEKLGTYDPGLEYWGGENIELSFKAWMCNGSVELIPCSHVGHIFRKSNPIKWKGNVGSKNSARVAEVWMDDYKNYFYERINYNLGDFGNVTERKLLRQRLGCHSFDWYMKNVFPNMVVPRNMKFAGEVRNVASAQCLDSMGAMDQQPKLFPCHSLGGNQFWYFSMEGDLYQDGNHICEKDGGLTQMGPCLTGLWQYTQTKTLLHVQSGKCLAGSLGTSDISLQTCNDSAWQKWTMSTRPADRIFP